MTQPIILTVFAVLSALSAFCFKMQRGALLITRIGNISSTEIDALLPLWLRLHPVVSITKWVLAGFVAWHAGWWWLPLLLTADFALGLVMPISYHAFVPVYERNASAFINSEPLRAIRLLEAIRTAKDHNFQWK